MSLTPASTARPYSLLWKNSVVIQRQLALDPVAQLGGDVHRLGKRQLACWIPGLHPRPPHPHHPLRTTTTHLRIFGLVLLYNKVTKRVVLSNEENITTKAVSSAYKRWGERMRAQSRAGRKEHGPADTSTRGKPHWRGGQSSFGVKHSSNTKL